MSTTDDVNKNDEIIAANANDDVPSSSPARRSSRKRTATKTYVKEMEESLSSSKATTKAKKSPATKTVKTTTTTTTTTAKKSPAKSKTTKTTAKAKDSPPSTTKAKRKRPSKTDESDDEEEDNDNDKDSNSVSSKASSVSSGAKKKPKKSKVVNKATDTKTAAATTTKTSSSDSENEDSSSKSPKKAKKAKKPSHQVITTRDEIPKLWNEEKAKENGSYTFKIASWNVAGLRAVLKKTPDALAELAKKHDLDVLCLQETKLQESHLDDPKLKIRGHLMEDAGYDAYYSCSTAKKGYSGTAVFVKRRKQQNGKGKSGKQQTTLTSYFSKGSSDKKGNSKKEEEDPLPISVQNLIPEKVTYEMGKDIHDAEGRMVIVDFPLFSLCNVYVPNSGQNLERLSYRTEEWDKDFLEFMQSKKKEKPIMWLGDLNVAHTNLEVWNDGAKHLAKQAGVTVEERASFQAQLDSGFVDAFRKLHPTAAGHYSYWSQRAGNREPNKGLRLDYFICDPLFFEESSKVVVRDSYMDFDQLGSDHCPAILELEIKP